VRRSVEVASMLITPSAALRLTRKPVLLRNQLPSGCR